MPDDFGRVRLPENLDRLSPSFDEDEKDNDEGVNEIIPDDSGQDEPESQQYNQPAGGTNADIFNNKISRDRALSPQPAGAKTAGFQKPQELPAELPPEHPFSRESLINRQLAGRKNALQNGSEAVRRTADAGKKAAQNALNNIREKLTRQAIKAAARAAWTSLVAFLGSLGLPIWAIVTVILLFIVLIAFAVFLGVGWYRNNSPGPKSTGGGAIALANPLADADWINSLLIYTGDSDPTKAERAKIQEKLKPVLEKANEDVNSDNYKTLPANILKSIKDILASINATLLTINSADEAIAKKNYQKLRDEINQLHDFDLFTIQPLPGTTSLPLHLPENELSFSQGLHDCSRWKSTNCGVAGHRTFLDPNGRSADADDISAHDSAGKPIIASQPIYAVFSGIIADIRAAGGDREHILLRNDDSTILVVYAHVVHNNGLKTGDHVDANQQIGIVNGKTSFSPHLHFEMYQIVNKNLKLLIPITFTAQEIKDCGLWNDRSRTGACDGKDYTIGKIYWDKAKTIFKSS